MRTILSVCVCLCVCVCVCVCVCECVFMCVVNSSNHPTLTLDTLCMAIVNIAYSEQKQYTVLSLSYSLFRLSKSIHGCEDQKNIMV